MGFCLLLSLFSMAKEGMDWIGIEKDEMKFEIQHSDWSTSIS